ncbi:PKD domain-containing protein [Pirellulales bacterium]|nr:PKD domain-containing protein [Pirellulales bacterium]
MFDVGASGDVDFAGTFDVSNATALGLGTDGTTLYAGGNNFVRVLQPSPSGLLSQVANFGTGTVVSDFAVNSTHQFLYIGKSGPNGIQVRRQDAPDDYQFVQNYPLADVVSLKSSGDGAHLYAGTSDGRLAVFQVQSNGQIQLVQELQNDVGGIRGLSRVDDLTISNDDAYLFAGSADDGTLLVFRRDATTGALTPVQRLRHGSLGATGLLGLTSLEITPDGSQIYATSNDGNFGGWSVLDVDIAPVQTAEPVVYRVGLDDAIASLDIYSGDGADVVSVANPAGIKTSVYTEGGNDNVIVVSQPAELDIRTGDGADHVEVRTTSGMLTDIELGDGQDSITVNGPGVQAPVDIDGGAPTTVPGDSLTYITGGQPTTPSVLTFPSGDVSVTDAQNVHYESIEEPPILDELNARILTPPTIDEGDSVDLEGSLTSGVDPRAEWDLNADGVFEDAFGFTATLSWSELQALGLDDDGVYPIALQVYSGRQRTFETSTLTIGNVAPELAAETNPAALTQFVEFDLNLSATDSGDDRIERWEVTWETGETPEVFFADAAIVQHVYQTSGSKTITIDAYDEDGGPYFTELLREVAAGTSPTRTLSGPTALLEGETATFDLTAFGGQTNAEEWLVSFGDGSTESTSGNTITHTYTDDGVYLVSAVVRESDGSFAKAPDDLIVTVENVEPDLTIGGGSPIDEGDLFTLDLSASDPGDDTIASWRINWGDGVSQVLTGSPSEVTHRYADDSGDGAYTITAIATDEDGSYVAPTTDVTVNNVALHEISGPATVNEDQVYLLELASFDPGDDTVSEWTINWGDDSGDETFDGRRRFVSHVYTGGFVSRTITAWATDEDDTFPTNSLPVDVLNVPPMPVLSGPSFAREANPYFLTLKSNSTIDTPIVQWEVLWDNISPLQVVDLDAPSADKVIDHTFPDGLDQTTIFATAIDAAGNRYPAVPLDVDIFNIAPTIEVANPNTVDEGSTFTLTLGEITEPAPDTVTDYIIYWGDGEQDMYTVAEIAALGGQVTHEYGDNSPPSPDPVNFPDPVTFIAVGLIDEDGTHAAAGFTTVRVLNVAPEVTEFTSDAASEETKSIDKHITVTGSVDDVGVLDTHVVNIEWGDGTISEGVPVDPATRTFTADYEYIDGGVYEITVTAIDDDGGISAPVNTSAIIQGVGIIDGTFFIVGSNGQDSLELDYNELLTEFSVDLRLNLDEFGNSSDQIQTTFLATDVNSLVAILCAGNDHFTASVSEDVVGPGDEDGRPTVDIRVDGSLGNDEFIVEANSIDAPLTILGGDDDDVVNVGAGELDAIEVDIQVALGDGHDSLIIDDRLRLEPTAYDLSPQTVRWGDDPNSPHVTYDGDLEALRVEGSVGPNVFTVSPSAVVDITVDGNAPITGSVPAIHGDSLFLRTENTAPRRISFDIPKMGNGRWTFSDGTRDLAFESIERFNHVERLAVAGEAAQDGRPIVKVFDAETKELLFQFFAYEEDFHDGVRVATGDVDGDGIPDIVVAPGRLHEPLVKVFDGLGPAVIPAVAADANGTGMVEGDDFLATQRNAGATQTPETAVASWEENFGGSVAEAISQASSDEFKLAEFLAYDQNFINGVALAVGDVTGDLVNDIVVAPSRGPAEVRVFENIDFSYSFDLFDSFLAYSPSFIGGASVAVGDLTGDGRGDIVTSTGSGSYVTIRVFDGQDLQTAQSGTPVEDFVAFDESVRGGSFVAIGNVVGDFTPDIVLGGGPYADSRVQVFDGANLPIAGTQFATPDFEYRLTMSPEENNRAPVKIAIKDYDLDGVADTIFGAQGADGEAQWLREFSPFDQSVVDALFEDDAEFINGFWIG